MKWRYVEALRWGEKDSEVVGVHTTRDYSDYKKRLPTYSHATYQYNYIYEITKPVRLFEGTERDCYRLVQAGYVDSSALDTYWAPRKIPTDPVELAKFLAEHTSLERSDNDLLLYMGVKTDDFRKLYDGTYIKRGEFSSPKVFKDVVADHLRLIDGTVLRLDLNPAQPSEAFPDWVMTELVRYTDAASKKMKPDVLKWLLEHSPKPYAKKRVYRGFSDQMDDWGDYSKLTMDAVNKKLYAHTGIRHVTDIRVGMKLKVKRGKESSWSISAQAATNFASGLAQSSINFLVKTDVPADRVIIDFTELPRDVLSTFKYQGQGEVIISSGPIDAVLDTLWLEPKFITWLNENGCEFDAHKGISLRA